MSRTWKIGMKYTLLLALALSIASCTAYKSVGYLKDAQTLSEEDLRNKAANSQPVIMPHDVLLITVNTPTPEASKDFNLPLIPQTSRGVLQNQVISSTESSGTLQNYMVDAEGYITFPVLGRISVSGLTQRQLEQTISQAIYPAYTKEKPTVVCRFLNYQVTVLGEVNNPGKFTSETGNITIFDAIALAGDLTIYGKRQNVMLIRTNADGQKKVFTINLQDKNLLLNSEVYNLQQNDVVYVEPNKTKGNNSQFGSLEGMTLPALSIVISIIAILVK